MAIRGYAADDPLEANAAWLVPWILFYAVYYGLCAGPKTGVVLSLLVGILSNLSRWLLLRQDGQGVTTSTLILRAVYVVSLAFVPLFFHLSTADAVIGLGKPLWDEQLVAMDTALMGWAWPQGQLALAVQDSEMIAPDQPMGRAVTELLQITYVSYYLWGNLLLIFLLARMCLDPKSPVHWRRLRMLSHAMAGGYMIVFLVNFAIPAMSPRLYLQSLYTKDLEGLFVARLLNDALKKGAGADANNPTSFGAFPSGHVGLTWLPAIAARRLGFVLYGRIATVGACLMSAAVLYLRYHYFSDMVFALLLVLGPGLWIGRLWRSQMREDADFLRHTAWRDDTDV